MLGTSLLKEPGPEAFPKALGSSHPKRPWGSGAQEEAETLGENGLSVGRRSGADNQQGP